VTERTKKPVATSVELKTDVANFMARADKVLAHRLAEHSPSFQVLLNFDPETTMLNSINIDWDHIDEQSWIYLAVLMRPIIFNESDPISFNKLSGALAREHEPLRTALKQGRQQFSAWQKHMYIGQQEMGPVTAQHKGLPAGTVTRLEFGEPDTVPDDVDLDQMVPDYVLADIYFNGLLWHSDTDKAAEFQAATPYAQAFYAKCGEIRTIMGIKYVRDLREFVVRSRALGFDF
jgi:hypothetical protein